MTAGTQITQICAHTGGTLTRQPGRAERRVGVHFP
jgi:hypothetical protein